jgi:hypothetical protein
MFMSKLAEKPLPFFKTPKGCITKSDSKWSPETEEASEKIKEYTVSLPSLTAPSTGERLFLYLSVGKEAIGVVLIADRAGKEMMVYFESRALKEAEVNYPHLEKSVLALVHASRRPRRYFQAYKVVILTDQPIKEILARPEKSGRLAKWVVELGEHDLEYQPRTTIKGQILVDFLIKNQ